MTAVSASDLVASGLLRDLEQQRLVPGQRLIETELAMRFGVGRNAVREAIHWLAAKGIVDLSRNRSPAIRRLSVSEVLQVLEVAEAMIGLLARIAARNFQRRTHLPLLRTVMQSLADSAQTRDAEAFARARRHLYRSLLHVGANRELERHFSVLDMQIVYAQYRSTALQALRLADYQAICQAVIDGNSRTAEAAARRHVKRVREFILKQADAGSDER